jgi:hypothetical protein
MRRFLLLVTVVLLSGLIVLLAPGASAGPQPLPDAPCAATATAHESIPEGLMAHERVAHQHDFDADTVFGCYHFNPVISEPGE